MSFDTWVDPPGHAPTDEWERRLDAYARKTARELRAKQVPLFRSEWPRGGRGTFVDSFWLIACDVHYGTRSWIAHDFTPQQASAPGYPPQAGERQFIGQFRGDGLLLTPTGLLCVARVDAFLTRSGEVNDRTMDMIFTEIGRPTPMMKSKDWGWWNRGRWRRDPKSDLNVYGVDTHTQSIRFEQRYHRKGPYPEDGRDTSAALTQFTRSGGAVRWPRGFVDFDWD